MAMRVLVSGAKGFVGSHFVDVLLARGDSVTVLGDSSAGGYRDPRATWLHGRCEDGWDPDANQVDAIIHCAGRADISNNWHPTHPNRMKMWGNLTSTTGLLEACVPRAIPFVLLSTAAVYGATDGGLLDETVAPRAESPYAASKIAAEAALAAYAKKIGFAGYSLRLAQVLGARYHHGHIYDFVKRYDAGEQPLRVRDNGMQKKSAVHVLDVVGAALALLDQKAPTGVYNVASKEQWSVRDTVRVMGVEAVYADGASAWVGDPKNLNLATWKLREFYRCERSLESGVREAVASIRGERMAA